MSLPSVTLVTPWLDHMELADDYWKAVAHAGPGVQVLVIDNGSNPPLPNGYRMGRNAGFNKACNRGLELAHTDAVIFLNNDVAATADNWAQTLRESLEDGVLVGAQLRNDPHAWVDGQQVPYLDGWCVGGMRADLLELGGFDETLKEPAYYGDNLLCLEARAAGMGLREVRVGLRHKLNVTAGHGERVTAATLANRERYEIRARQLLGGMVAA